MSRYEGGHHGAAAAAVAGYGGMSIQDGGGGDAHEDDLVMPGFRFHLTEEELIEFYLRRKVEGKRFNVELIAFLDLYRYEPWELPALAAIGGKEWFFYVPRDRKYRNGDRPNRVTASGYWKATGVDRMIRAENSRPIGLKKTLVFYSGKAPKGVRRSWIMNEYRLPTADTDRYHKTEISLCRVYKRSGINDAHGHPFLARSKIPFRGGATETARKDNHQGSSSTSTPTRPPTLSKLHLLQAGECTSPLAPLTDHAQTHGPAAAPRLAATVKSCGGPLGYLQLAAATDDHQQEGAAALLYQHQQYSKNTNTFASPYSLLNLVNAASMGVASAAAINQLSTVVGHGAAQLPSCHSPTAGGHHDHFIVPLPTQSSQPIAPLGALPMSLASISSKIWDWNPIPDAAAG